MWILFRVFAAFVVCGCVVEEVGFPHSKAVGVEDLE